MMKKFKELFLEKAFLKDLPDSSVKVDLESHNLTLALKFDSKDVILDAGYRGAASPWMSSLCALLIGKNLEQALKVNLTTWDEAFREEQYYWDLKQEISCEFVNAPLELLHAALDVFRGREYLYHEEGPLVCRCFGIRESDITEHLKKTPNPTLDTLSGETKAGMGCRTCVPQLKKWVTHFEAKSGRHFKERAVSEWLLEIDQKLSTFAERNSWKLEITGMKGSVVYLSFDKDVTQKEEEDMGKNLQRFLGEVDPELSFFLRRPRHFSKADG